MTRMSTYAVERFEGKIPGPPWHDDERDAVFQLTDCSWRLIFRDAMGGVSCGLLNSRLKVEPAGARACTVAIEHSSNGASGTVVLRAPAARVEQDLNHRLASVGRSSATLAAVERGEWWSDPRLFEALDWSGSLSVAGVHYRAGWWGTGRFKPSMSAKVLDFGRSGIVLRGWRPRLLIPWDAVASIEFLAGDCWRPEELFDQADEPGPAEDPEPVSNPEPAKEAGAVPVPELTTDKLHGPETPVEPEQRRKTWRERKAEQKAEQQKAETRTEGGAQAATIARTASREGA